MTQGKIYTQKTGSAFFINTAAFIIVVAGMKASSSLLVPFLFALFISIICFSPFFWLQRKRIPKGIALLIIIFGILILGFLFGALIGTSINQFTDNMPTYEKILEEKTRTLVNWLEGMGIKIPSEQLVNSFSLKEPLALMASLLRSLSNVLSNTVLILMIIIFILLEAADFPGKLRAISQNPESSIGNFLKINDNIKRYIAIKTLLSLFTGIGVFIWLSILNIDYALLWGMLAFILNFIPNIGSIIAAIPAILLALIQHGLGSAMLTTLGYLIVNFIFGNVLEPRMMGKGLGLSTLIVFLSLIFWGWILGPIGMLLSVPLTMVAKIALDNYEDTRWIAILLGSTKKD
jgi:AI-2 transport protein TqsA